MLQAIHPVLLFIYLAAPVIALGVVLRPAYRQRRPRDLAGYISRWIVGAAVAGVVCMIRAHLERGRVRADQVLYLTYFATAALCLMRWVDVGLTRLMFSLLRARPRPGVAMSGARQARGALAFVLQRVVLVALALPYLTVVIALYQPRVAHSARPRVEYEEVSFKTPDGVRLSGWWVPASPLRSQVKSPQMREWGTQTVIVVPGFGSRKEHLVTTVTRAQTSITLEDVAGVGVQDLYRPGMIETLARSGFNVLVFDPRGQGDSQGHFSSLGDAAQRDVLGAAAWVKRKHPNQAAKIMGVGFNTGSAALLAAATSRAGADISAVVLYEPYADADQLVQSAADRVLPRPLNHLLRYVGLPIASLHEGVNLERFAPAGMSEKLWPRPMMVIHGRGDSFLSSLAGMDVYRNASEPRDEFWPAVDYENPKSMESKSVFDLLINGMRKGIGAGGRHGV